MLEDGNAEVAVALGVEIVEDGAVVCARHAEGLLRKRRSASVVTASPFCFRISQSGELSVFYHKIPSALYKKSVQNNSSYKYL